MAIFDGFEVTGPLPENELMAEAVEGRLNQVFGVDDAGILLAGVEQVRTWALEYINDYADQKALGLDDTLWFSEAQLPLEFAADELNRWYAAGSPASPPPAQYKIANKLSVVRGETIDATIIWMADKWQTLYSQTSDLVAERYDFIQQIQGAATIEEIQTILVDVAAW